MAKYKIFLRWWLIFVVIMLLITNAYAFGLIGEVWNNDFTKLSFVNLTLLIITSIWCGVQTFHFSKLVDNIITPTEALKKLSHNVEIGWFVSDLTLTIGMVGTVIGFIAMLSGFIGLDIENVNTIQELIRELGSGMSAALYTTLTGLISSAFLKIQCFNISYSIDKYIK
jgi:flagellar motor component MotA